MHKKIFALFIAISFIIKSSYSISSQSSISTGIQQDEEILLLQELGIHGTTYPKTDSSLQSDDFKNMRTELHPYGERQLYILGKNLKEVYPSLFDHYFLRDEILVMTTSHDRTAASAISKLYGIFEDLVPDQKISQENDDSRLFPELYKNYPEFNKNEIKFDSALPFKSVMYPVHTPFSEKVDYLLRSDKTCTLSNPKINRHISEKYNNLNQIALESKFYQETVQLMTEKFEIKDQIDKFQNDKTKYFEQVAKLAEYYRQKYQTNQLENFNIEESNSDNELYQKMDIVYNIYSSYTYWNDPYTSRLYASPILSMIGRNIILKSKNYINLDKFQEEPRFKYKTNNVSSWSQNDLSNLKYMLLSGQKEVLLQLQSGLQLYNPECLINFVQKENEGLLNWDDIKSCMKVKLPGVSSLLLFELVKKEQDLMVRISYDGYYLDLCNVNKKPNEFVDYNHNERFGCKVEEFLNLLLDKIYQPDTYESICFGNKPKEDKTITLTHIFMIVTLVVQACGLPSLVVMNNNMNQQMANIMKTYYADPTNEGMYVEKSENNI